MAASLRTAPPTGAAPTTTGPCTGDGCRTREAWPLHHVKHRGELHRFCTGCMLKYHPSLFCSLCFDLIDSLADPSPPPNPNPNPNPTTNSSNLKQQIIHCSSCHNVCHASCLPPSSSSDFFLCPSCSSSATASAAADALTSSNSSSRRRTLDLPYARTLLCAARLSAQSMTRVAAAARSDADRKAKEAAAARKRAREMLERVAAVAKSFRDKDKDQKEQEPREKDQGEIRGKGKWGLGVPVGPGGRERDKWMRLYEMSTPFHDGDKPLPGTLPITPAAKFEHDEAKDTVARKPSAVLPSSVSKGTPSS
ncbi:hypothetical protein LUZ61_016325 [Rhynchospora tenuis]|uniref:Phorbol-ester/DAG-type domain-containing protein n=1 Tax=Rhynchospora tenuis TaxID=198213 RepID=A0AAD5Z5D2_9POAL|nr:hypothetical protein LUZ61_016325 [Rhynchospora tenuis]